MHSSAWRVLSVRTVTNTLVAVSPHSCPYVPGAAYWHLLFGVSMLQFCMPIRICGKSTPVLFTP